MSMASSGQPPKPHPLLEAASQGDLPRLKKVAVVLNVDGKGIKRTIESVRDDMVHRKQSTLHRAAKEGKVDVCKYLIDNVKPDVNMIDDKGVTPLIQASIEGHTNTAEYFLTKGADPNLKNDNSAGPLHYDVIEGHLELIRLLLSKGDNVDSLSRTGPPPLQIASGKGRHEAIKILLDHYANLSLYINKYAAPLLASISAKSLRCLELLLEAGADPDVVSHGLTPLGLAAAEGESEMIQCLLEAGVDPNIADDLGKTPIESAALQGKRHAVKILFPVSSPVPAYIDRSISGIMRDVRSVEVVMQKILKPMEKFGDAKPKGDAAFREKDYQKAVSWYTKAINGDPNDATILSNRSLCWARLKDGHRSLSDAKACIEWKPHWSKAYYREGAAWNVLGKLIKQQRHFVVVSSWILKTKSFKWHSKMLVMPKKNIWRLRKEADTTMFGVVVQMFIFIGNTSKCDFKF